MEEIFRVLKPRGYALITVPQDFNREHTVEFQEPDPFDSFHVRLYGKDFQVRLTEAGFAVQILNSSDMVEKSEIEGMKLGQMIIYAAQKALPNDCFL